MATTKYPWKEWFSKPITIIKRDIDYHISQSTMYQMVRNNASQRGLRVKLTDNGDSITIEITGRTKSEVSHTSQATINPKCTNALDNSVSDVSQTKESNQTILEENNTAASAFSRDHNPPRPTPIRR